MVSRGDKLFSPTTHIERRPMTSGYIPASGEPGADEILATLKEAIREDPGLREHSAEDISHELVRGGYSRESPPPPSSRRCWGLSNAKRDRASTWTQA
jgi:hypothetical protein